MTERSIPAKAGAVLFAVTLYFAIQFPSAWAGQQNPWRAPPDWVESGAWLYMTVHHLAQMLLALAVILVLSGMRPRRWGLNFGNAGESLRLTVRFALWFGLFIAVGFLLQLIAGAQPPHRPLTTGHVLGGLAFMWLVSGVSEEILFRGLFQTFFARFWTGVTSVAGIEIPWAGIVAAIFFSLVHINFSFRTGEITHLSVPQLAIAFALGLFYAIAYHRTGSLLAPALAHNISNGMMETSALALAALR